MAVWQKVTELVDGSPVAAETFNPPIAQLASRTDYLKDMLDRLLDDGGRGAITVRVQLSASDTPVAGDIVCVDPATGLYRKAIASMDLYDAYTASEKAFAIGILVNRDPDSLSGLVTLYGRISLSGLNTSGMVDGASGVFTGGQYYLSSTAPGKITRFPNGPRILIGYFARAVQKNGSYNGDVAFINPQHMDIESHAHRTYTLLARPCGVSSLEFPDNSNDYTDSTDSNDSNDQLPAGRVVVNGYLPQEVANGGVGIPYLVVCGDWTVDYAESYAVTVSNGVVDCNEQSTKWPVDVEWCKVGANECGSGKLNFFGDSIAVGKHGLRIKLQPSAGMSEDTPFGVRDLTDEQRTWSIDRFSGCGWSKADADTVSEFGSGMIRFGGVSDKFMNHIVVQAPEKIYDLTTSIARTDEGDRLEVDGRVYVFTTSLTPEDSNDSSEEVTYIQILDNTVQHDTFDTLAQLCDYEDGAVFYEDRYLRQVLLGADDVLFNDEPLTPAVSGTSSDMFALVSYDNGESLLAPVIVGQARELSVVKVDPWKVVQLRNGLNMMVFPGGGLEFGSKAVADIYCVPGSKFRYNIEFDNDLKLHFPPVPARSGCLMLNGVELESYENYGNRAVIAIGDDSIYWRDDTEGRQPWPFPDMAQYDKVPAEDEYRELFHFVSEFHSETGPVTSLHPAEGSPITIRRCGTDEDATVGDLELDVDLMLGMSDRNTPGYKVPKAFRGGKFLLGPVVEKVVAGPGISISKKAGVPDGQGVVTISADGSQYAGDFETVALENAKLESVGMFPYTRLLKWDPASDSNIPTGFVAKFHVPATASDAVYRVKFYATVFGEASFSGEYRNAGVRMDYSILPDFTMVGSELPTANLKTGLIRPDESVVLDIPFGAPDDNAEVSYTAYDPILVHNDAAIADVSGRSARVLDYAFPTEKDCAGYVDSHAGKLSGVFGIRPGYTVAIRFSRDAPSSGTPYTGAIGFLNLRWAVEEVSVIDVGGKTYDDIVAITVANLRKAARKSGPFDTGYSVADFLTKVANALR